MFQYSASGIEKRKPCNKFLVLLHLYVCRSLKITAIDAELRLIASASVHFDSELPHYGTKDGVHRDPKGETPHLWAMKQQRKIKLYGRRRQGIHIYLDLGFPRFCNDLQYFYDHCS